MRLAITRNYSFKATSGDKVGFITPYFNQWFDDGIVLLEGEKPWEGTIALYRGGQLNYAVASRDAKSGEELDPREFLTFVSMDDFRESLKQIPRKIASQDEPLNELNSLLIRAETKEEEYHSWFRKYPWAFGLLYRTFQDRGPLDDSNIPDFTGVRIHDGCRDIFEIKQPFLNLFREDGEFTSDFNESWNQAERYLIFARQNQDYLNREKGLRFNNPKCHLLAGFNLSDEQRKKIGVKEQSNASIEFRTYNDLVSYVTNTISFIKNYPGATYGR
jgi:hypothetical protein